MPAGMPNPGQAAQPHELFLLPGRAAIDAHVEGDN